MKKTSKFIKFSLAILMVVGLSFTVQAQEYRSATAYGEPGKAPGMKVKLLSEVGDVKHYVIIFALCPSFFFS